MRLRVLEEDGNTTMLHANTTEVNLAHVTLCSSARCVDCKQIFAERPSSSVASTGKKERKGRTNSRRKRVPAVDLLPSATRVLDPRWGLALDSDIAIRSDLRACSAGRDAQILHFGGSWVQAMPRAESVSARHSSVNETFCEREGSICERGMSVLACISRLLAASPCQFEREKDLHEGGHRP